MFNTQISRYNINCAHLLSLCSLAVAWFGHLFTTSWTCSGFIYIGIARIWQPDGGDCNVLNWTGHVVAILTYNLSNLSEYCEKGTHFNINFYLHKYMYAYMVNVWIRCIITGNTLHYCSFNVARFEVNIVKQSLQDRNSCLLNFLVITFKYFDWDLFIFYQALPESVDKENNVLSCFKDFFVCEYLRCKKNDGCA